MSALRIQKMDWKIAISIGLCMLTFLFVPQLQLLSACTAALMCTQENTLISWKSSLTRVLVTVVGGALAVLVVVLDNMVGSYPVFILLSMAGIVLTLMLCRVCKTPPISGRIGVITFILVVVVAQGEGRIIYALQRLIASTYGAAVAVGINALIGLIPARKTTASAAEHV